MQDNQVTTVADDNGNVIRQSINNPEYGFVRVTQDAVQFGSNGWVNRKSRSALILGKMEDLKELGLDKIQTLPGRICIKESTETFNENDPDRSLKIAGSTGVICCTSDGEPIHRTSFYDASGLQKDELIAHANGDAIREANGNGAKTIAKSEFKSEDTVESKEDVIEDVIENSEEIEESEESVEIEESKEDTFEL